MSACTFFGHRDCPTSIKAKLEAVVRDLIENQGVDRFYVGHQGQFDAQVQAVLWKLLQEYPHIHCAVVLAYMPRCEALDGYQLDTILPQGIESVYPRYAIAWRNQWMLRKASHVVAYVDHPWGGAAVYYQKAIKQGKQVYSLR